MSLHLINNPIKVANMVKKKAAIENAAATEEFEDDESENSDDDGDEEGSESSNVDKSSEDNNSEDDSNGSSNRKQVLGKEGWVYRENDPGLHLADTYSKIWISISANRLLFSRESTNSGSFTLFESTKKDRSYCFGYLDLTSSSEVKRVLLNSSRGAQRGKITAAQQDKPKKFQFIVKDGDTTVTFAADTESERDEWVSVIKAAITGTVHFLPLSHLELPHDAILTDTTTTASDISTVGRSMKIDTRRSVVAAAVDFPNKGGYLKKTSQGKGTFAISVSKKRWFRLIAGELRYYEDEDESATKLKECIHLEGAHVLPLVDTTVQLQFSGQRSMKLEAATMKIATEWRDAFTETIVLLGNMPSTQKTAAALKPVRRLNIHDSVVVDSMVNTTNSAQSMIRMSSSSAMSPVGGSGSSPMAAGNRRARAATTVVLTPPGKGALRQSNDSSSDSSDDETPPASGSFWKRLSLSSSPKVGGDTSSPLAKQRCRSATTLVPSNAAAAAGGPDYRPKFLHKTAPGSTVKSIETTELLKQVLSQNFLVKRLLELLPLIELMQEHIAVPGEVVIWQGSSGDSFYVLESGQCEVIKDGRCVSRIPAGKSFGELALVNNATRQATIRASQVSTLWSFSRNQFREIAMQQEAQQLAERIQFLQQIALFSKLMPSSLEKIADVMVLKSYNTSERIIKQGDVGDAFYMIQQGRAVVTQTTTFGSSNGTELARLGPGKYFGELALIEDAPRKATVTATSACKCWTLDRHNFKSLFGSMDEAVNESVGIQMLQKVKLLEALSERQLQEVSRCLVSKLYVEGEMIIKQGDVGDCFYLIAEGEVSVQVNHIQVATLEEGSYFGEMSLLSNERRSATVAALKDTTCLILSRSDFNELLGPLEELNEEAQRRKELAQRSKAGDSGSRRFMSSLFKVSDSIFGSSPSSSPSQSSSLARKKSLSPNPKTQNSLFSSTSAMFELSSLERVRKLGTGTFGTVYLVQHIMSSKFYALKVLHKQTLKEKCQEEYIYSERDIMLALSDSLFVTELYATLQDQKSLFLVMPYIPGGDLWELLYNSSSTSKLKRTKEGGFTLNKTVFYISNVLMALNHIHDQEIIYRNIKPENFVIDGSGYLKMVDFGTAKRLPIGMKTNTLCGAADYIAPEMVLSKGYNKAIDFWALGVLMFELLTAQTPFAHINLAMVYQNILDAEGVLKLIFSGGQTLSASATSSSAVVGVSAAGLDPQAKHAISGFLLHNPNMRLGMRHDGIRDIWTHPCFKDINQEEVAKKTAKAPYVPNTDETQLGQATDEEVLDLVEDEDDIPVYTGRFDYSDF